MEKDQLNKTHFNYYFKLDINYKNISNEIKDELPDKSKAKTIPIDSVNVRKVN